MPDRIVRIILSGNSRGAVRAIEETEAATERFADKAKRVGGGLKTAGRDVSYFSGGIAAVGYESAKSAISYQKAMTLIRTQTGASSREIGYLNRNLMRIGGQYGFDPTQMATGLYAIESAGLRGHAALAALIAGMKGAQIGGDSLASTTDAIAGALRTQTKDVHSAAQGMAVLDAITGQGKMRLADLTQAMTTGILPTAKSLGLGLRDVGAALADLTRQGIPAEQGATRLRFILTRMAAPSGVASKQLLALHMTQNELANDLRKPHGLIVALTDLKAHLADLSKNQRTQALSNIFGGSRGTLISVLLNGLSEQRKIRDTLSGAGSGTLAAHWAETQRTASFQLARAWAQLETAATRLGQAIIPVVIPMMRDLARYVSDAARWFNHLSPSMRHTVVIAGMLATALGPVLFITGALISTIGDIASGFTFLFGAESGVLAITTALEAMLGVGLIIGLVVLYAKVRAFRDVVNSVFGYAWKYIKQVFADLMQTVRGFLQFVSGIWDVIKGIWTLNGHEIAKGMKNIFHGMIGMIVGEFKSLAQPLIGEFEFIKRHWHTIMHDFVAAVKWAVHAALSAFKLVGNALGVTGNSITSYLNPVGIARHIGGLFHLHFAGGGLVPASGASGGLGGGAGGDTVPAMLTPGEFVLRPQVVSAIGTQNLNSLNQSGSMAGGQGQGDIIIPITLKVGERVMTQAVARYSSQMAARK